MINIRRELWEVIENVVFSEINKDDAARIMLSASYNDYVNHSGIYWEKYKDRLISLSAKPEFGQYQFNFSMAFAKTTKNNPRNIAQSIANGINAKNSNLIDRVEVAGPGFINIYLNRNEVAKSINCANSEPNFGMTLPEAQTIVVDYSAPNLAKEMHVGHLRSTIIGDAVTKTLEYLGHNVIRQNHMGDWGTQFGMLLAHLSDKLDANQVAGAALSDLEGFYREAKIRFDEEDGFADRAREYVVKLQSGDAQCLGLWKQFIDVSVAHSQEVYDMLGVSLTDKDIRGESAYNEDLPQVVRDLTDKQLLVEDQGAQVVFLGDEFADKDGNPAAYIVQKSGGGFLYSTTDLAAIRYRAHRLNATRTLIFTDARQALHFAQTEAVARKAGFFNEGDSYEHCPFGMMLGKDGKPFKTRTGGTVKLIDLLNEAVERAEILLAQRDNELTEQERSSIAKEVGIGAVKYADLSKNRTTDYVFDWDTMLKFEGNTAPYLQYAFTRINSILQKAAVSFDFDKAVVITEEQEFNLAFKLTQFEDTVKLVGLSASPHYLCTYIYQVAGLFMSFYEACPILKDGIDTPTKESRLTLAVFTAKVLKQGLDLLGINTLQKM